MATSSNSIPRNDAAKSDWDLSLVVESITACAKTRINNGNQSCDDELMPLLTEAAKRIEKAVAEKKEHIKWLRRSLDVVGCEPLKIKTIENRLSQLTTRSGVVLPMVSSLAVHQRPVEPPGETTRPISITSSPPNRQSSIESDNAPGCNTVNNTDVDTTTSEQPSGAEALGTLGNEPGEAQHSQTSVASTRKRTCRQVSDGASEKTDNRRNKKSRKTQSDLVVAGPATARTEDGSDIDDTTAAEFVLICTTRPDSPFIIRCKDTECPKRKSTKHPFRFNRAVKHFNDNHRAEGEEYQTEEYIWQHFGVKVLDVDATWVEQRAKVKKEPFMWTPKISVPELSEPIPPRTQGQYSTEPQTNLSPDTITCAPPNNVDEEYDGTTTATPTTYAQVHPPNISPDPSLDISQTNATTNLYDFPSDDEALSGCEGRDATSGSEYGSERSWCHGIAEDNPGSPGLRPFGHTGQWARRFAPKEH